MTEQQRANELAKIINNASKGLTAEDIFESGVSIKTKVSKSNWYNSQEGSDDETVFTIDFDKVGTHRLMAMAPIRKAED